MVWQAQPERTDAKTLQTGAERIVLRQFCVPMRQHDNGFASSITGRKPAGAYNIILRERSVNGRGKLQPVAVEFEIGRRLVAEELPTMGNGGLV